ncbi:MAG TPA: hypothetical protein VGZ25_02005 [Gemmataceae bacterium]|jgi:hypothetical protein|nr:hypothetical protein [Gemmataceae bacterium]
MSFDVFLVSFADQNASSVPRSIVQNAFGEFVHWKEDTGQTKFGECDGSTIYLSLVKTDENLVDCILINRPIADERFWKAIYEIMKNSNMAFLFPGGKGPIIANASFAKHLPISLGTPIIVATGREIVEEIERP